MEFMEDYDFKLHYHLEKANVVTNSLSRKSMSIVASLAMREWEILGDLGEFD